MIDKKRLLLLSYYFPPIGGGGVQRIVKMLKFLDPDRYDITVFTATEAGLEVYDPDLLDEVPSWVKIIRIPHTPPHHYLPQAKAHHYETSLLKRWFSSLLFVPDSRKSWKNNVKAYISNSYKTLSSEFDLILATVPPYSVGVLAKDLSGMFSVPYIIDFRDGWMNHPFQIYPTPIHTALHRHLERQVIEKAAGCVFSTEASRLYYLEKYHEKLEEKPITTIYNGADPNDFILAEDTVDSREDFPISVGIPGTIYFTATRPLTLVQALQKLAGDNHHFHFHIIGKWTVAFEKLVYRKRLDRYFTFHSYRSHREYLKFLSDQAILFLFLEPSTSHIRSVIPGRFFELMMMKKPLVIFGPAGHEIQSIIQRYGHPGRYVENTPEQVLQFLAELPQSWPVMKEETGRYDFSKVMQDFSREKLAKQWDDFFQKVLLG